MKSRPILFSAPMVRALLDGSKTQTRRVIKPQPDHRGVFEPAMAPGIGSRINKWAIRTDIGFKLIKCPYGRIGDLLYVRETIDALCGCDATYLADDNRLVDAHPEKWDVWRDGRDLKPKTIPSIFMPRWASRLTLEVTNIRAERLHEISENDALAEGCKGNIDGLELPSEQYRDLWKSINGKKSWDVNPWVWVVEFKVHHKNVDALLAERKAA